MKRKLAAGLLVPVVFVLVAACGGGGDGGNKVASAGTGAPSSSSDQPKGADLSAQDEDKMREFAKCMRENGVEMPDPKGGGAGMAIQLPEGGEEVMKKADEACKKYLPNGGEYKEPSQEEKDKMREQAKCMREHGIDMPDPDFSGTSGRSVELDDTEKFKQAMKDCGMGDGGFVTRAEPANG